MMSFKTLFHTIIEKDTVPLTKDKLWYQMRINQT